MRWFVDIIASVISAAALFFFVNVAFGKGGKVYNVVCLSIIVILGLIWLFVIKEHPPWN